MAIDTLPLSKPTEEKLRDHMTIEIISKGHKKKYERHETTKQHTLHILSYPISDMYNKKKTSCQMK